MIHAAGGCYSNQINPASDEGIGGISFRTVTVCYFDVLICQQISTAVKVGFNEFMLH